LSNAGKYGSRLAIRTKETGSDREASGFFEKGGAPSALARLETSPKAILGGGPGVLSHKSTLGKGKIIKLS